MCYIKKVDSKVHCIPFSTCDPARVGPNSARIQQTLAGWPGQINGQRPDFTQSSLQGTYATQDSPFLL